MSCCEWMTRFGTAACCDMVSAGEGGSGAAAAAAAALAEAVAAAGAASAAATAAAEEPDFGRPADEGLEATLPLTRGGVLFAEATLPTLWAGTGRLLASSWSFSAGAVAQET